ncbi:MAG: threonine/serine exporter family protein [Mycobacteriaceae bacterium]
MVMHKNARARRNRAESTDTPRWPDVGEPTPDGGISAPSHYSQPAGPVLADDASVTDVLDLALGVGEILLSNGVPAVDAISYIRSVTAAYGLPRCEVDITFTSITISAHRGLTRPPVNLVRVVRYRSLDYTRLAAVDQLVQDVVGGRLTTRRAHAELDRLNSAPHPYRRWTATLAWAAMAASVAVLLGGGALVIGVAFLSTVAIDRTNRVLNSFGLPFFFQQVAGGFIATMPAAALFAVHAQLGLVVRPSQIVAAGVVVLLSGLSLVGSVQDAITGSLVTGSARFAEMMVQTVGIIVGLAIALKVSSALGVHLPPLGERTYALSDLPAQVLGAAGTSAFFALASYAERRALLAAAAAGATGWLVFGLLTQAGSGPVTASALAATLVGFIGAVISHRTRVPPMVVWVSGIAPLLPALAVYRGLYSLMNSGSLLGGFTELGGALGVAGALAAGVVLGEWAASPVRSRLRRLTQRVGTRHALIGDQPRRPGGSPAEQ